MKFDRCFGCMEYLGENTVCPSCSFDNENIPIRPRCIQPGQLLRGRYVIGKVLGEGGFGITYIAWDTLLEIVVAVKEYFPSNLAGRDTTSSQNNQINIFDGREAVMFQTGLQRLRKEAKLLSQFRKEPSIVEVQDFFEENGTGYIIMEYVEGISLRSYISRASRIPPEDVLRVVKPLMFSLAKIHKAGVVHRDISPDNIMINKQGTMILIDFGATRKVNTEEQKSLTVMIKRGFAPEEQYRSKGKQGSWTDVYALCATMYCMMTGEAPPEAMERVRRDTLKPFREFGISMPAEWEHAMKKGLAVYRDDRYQTIGELYAALYGEELEADLRENAEEKRKRAFIERMMAREVQARAEQMTRSRLPQERTVPNSQLITVAAPGRHRKLALFVLLVTTVIVGIFVWRYPMQKGAENVQ